MKRNHKFLFVALLAGVFAFGMVACGDDSAGAECGNGVCEGDEATSCPQDCDPCNHDGVCDPGESCTLCRPNGGENADCCTSCDLDTMTGADHDFIVSELFLPTTPAEAGNNGVDIDGDGEIDNKLGQIITMLSTYMDDDINVSVNAEIIEGSLLLASRVRESGAGDGVVAVQIFQGEIYDATPVFGGADNVAIPAGGDDLYLCGEWDSGPILETSPADVTIAFPLPEIGTLELTLTNAQIRVADDPDSPYYDTSAVYADSMADVMIGGGISQEELYGPGGLIEFLGGYLQTMIDEGGETADTILGIFDNGCAAQPNIAGCENAAPDTGNCMPDGVIHVDELKCNSLLSTALGPDVDSDGDGVDDLVSLGLRVVSAVPATLHFQ